MNTVPVAVSSVRIPVVTPDIAPVAYAPVLTVSTAPLTVVFPPVTLIPDLAVITPTESMLVTSS